MNDKPRAGAVGGLLMEVPVALFLMPSLYVLFHRGHEPAVAGETISGGGESDDGRE